MNNLFILFLIIFCQFKINFSSSINCTFEDKKEGKEDYFCGWKPESNLWKTGNAVLVDSVNSVIHSSNGGDSFAYVQGHYGLPTEGTLKSPIILSNKKYLRFSYWKISKTASLDICIEKEENNKLIIKCIYSIKGKGENKWIIKLIKLFEEEEEKQLFKFKLIFKAKNLLSAEDIIGIDDIELLNNISDNLKEEENKIMKNKNIKIKKQIINNKEEEEEEELNNNNNITSSRIIPYSQINKKNNNSSILKNIRLSQVNGKKNNNKLFKNIERPNTKLLLEGPSFTTTKIEERIVKNEQCTAISCSFMEGICFWNLGQGWKSDSHGSISIELILLDHSQLISALFRPPVASYVDFDLWLSNNVKFMVAEQIINNNLNLNEDDREEKEIIKLFEREGATDGGWHRFRVPLRPSFLPVRLLFIVELILYSKKGINEEEGFVSLSNIKLVNNEGIEIGCQTLEDIKLLKTTTTTTIIPFIKEEENIKEYERKLLADAGIEWLSKQAPISLKLTTNEFNTPITSTFSSSSKHNSILKKEENLKIPTKIFNPFQPLFEGIAPIIPQQNNPQRLTALMDKQNNIQLTKHLLQPNNAFPQLISPFAILQPYLKEENNLMENEKNIQNNQQMIYGATPIEGLYSDIEHEEDDEKGYEGKQKEGLLPFDVKEELNLENEENNRKKENNELTLPSNNDQKNVLENLNKDLFDEDNNNKFSSEFSSSLNKGWSERLEKSIENAAK